MFFLYYFYLSIGAFIFVFGLGMLVSHLSGMAKGSYPNWGSVLLMTLLSSFPTLVGFTMIVHYYNQLSSLGG